MGTWGYGAFDDDTALDFVYEVTEKGGDIGEDLRVALVAVGDEDYLDFGVSVPARVAAALVAGRREPGLPVPEEYRELEFEASAELCASAVRAIDRILDPADNEWYELWTEDGPLPEEIRAELDAHRAALTS